MANPSWLKAEESATNAPKVALPLGGYVVDIIGAKKEADKLVIQFDICEGEFNHFYHAEYESKKGGKYPAKYGGEKVLYIPTGDGSEKDGWTMRTFNNFVWAVEDSNPGFKFDFDRVSTLVSKKVGIMVREYYWAMDENGEHKQGVKHEVGGFTNTAKARNCKKGEAPMKPRKAKGYVEGYVAGSAPATESNSYTPVEDEELPF